LEDMEFTFLKKKNSVITSTIVYILAQKCSPM